MKTNERKLLALFASVLALGSAFAAPVVTNTITVTASGPLAEPVVLHQPEFQRYLDDPDPGNWKPYMLKNALQKRYINPYVVRITDGTDSQFFTNLYPGASYSWSVGGLSGTFVAAAQAPRTLMVPRIDWVEVWNFRDLGGWRLIGSRTRRTNFDVFFRSSHWDYYETPEQKRICPMNSAFGIRSEIDLRREAEISVFTDYPEYDGTLDNERYVDKEGRVFTSSPSLPPDDTSVRFFHLPIDHVFLKPGSGYAANFARIFHVLGQKKYHPVVFHCAGGKDRTENVAFFILALCGVEFEDICRDDCSTVFAILGPGHTSPATYDKSLTDAKYMKYGPTLAGRVRAYLEKLGVTPGEIARITMAVTGELPDTVLKRVSYFAEHHEPLPPELDHGDPDFEDAEAVASAAPAAANRPGTRITDRAITRRGGDEVYQLSEGGTNYYVHYFTSTAKTQVFSNATDRTLTLDYLVVGGGGAGGDSGGNNNSRWGGGGGAGGGVVGDRAELASGAVWQVKVGVGGEPFDANGNHLAYNVARGVAGASEISSSEGSVARAPGGGAGGCTTDGVPAQKGAAGGGAGATGRPAKGTFVSRLGGVSYGPFDGGNRSSVKVDAELKDNNTLAGGGAGAAGAGGSGDPARRASGDGGPGLASSITGTNVVYGAGGGGGGGAIVKVKVPLAGEFANGFAYGVIPGEGANGAGRGGDTFFSPTPGEPGTGCGGGGASAGQANSARGGSGVVIIRYAE